MDERQVPDGDVIADPGAAVVAAGDMDDGAVLHVGAGADADRREIAAQHAGVPDVGAGSHLHVADERRVRCHEGIAGDGGKPAAERQDEIAQGKSGSWRRPAVSGKPISTFMFCTAWPEAPLTRLSIAETRMARPESRSFERPMRQRLEPRT